jgi:tetratricopeptide (TPR) repeat protein
MIKGWQITVLVVVVALAACGVEPAAAPSLGAARAALEDGLYDLAERQLQGVVAGVDRASPGGQEALVLLARALHGQGRYADVLALASQSSGKSQPPLAGGLVFWRAMARYDLAQYDAALADVRDFAVRFPGDPNVTRAARLAAWCQLKAGRTKEALAAFEQFDQAHGSTPAGLGNLLDWGQALLAVGRAGDAAATFERLATRAPDSGEGQEARLALSQALIQQGHWEAAWNLLNLAASDAAVRVDRRTRAWLALGDLNAVRTNYEASVTAAVKALELAPTALLKNRALAMQGRWLIKVGKLEEGVAQLRQVVAATPRDPLAGDLQLELAAAFQEAKQYEKAADEFQRYLETFTDPAGQFRALKGRAWALWSLARYAESGAVFEKAAAAAPGEAEKEACLLKAADSAFANGQYKAAGEAYDRVLAQFPRTALSPQTLFQVAESLGRQNQWEPAERRFRSLARDFPEHPLAERALMRIAEMKEAQGPAGMRDALAAYAEVMAIYTNGALFAEALHRHGLVAYQLLQFDQALRDFTRVVNEYGTNRIAPQAFFYRGWSFYMMGREEEAVAVCRAFVTRYPDTEWTPRVVFWLGEYAFNHGQFSEAETNFTSLVETYPKDVLADQALLWAGRSAASRKEYLRAVDLFARAARTYPDSTHMDEIRFSQGDALTELGEFSQAIVVFDDLINKYPASHLVPAAWGRRGDCQLTLGLGDPRRYEEAIGSYRAVLNGAAATLDLVLQAEYKIGRCLEKLGRRKEAFEQYYTRVVCRYLDEEAVGEPPAGAAVWFTKAAFSAADILEADKDWRRAVRVLERVVNARVSASADAQARIKRIRAEHWIP